MRGNPADVAPIVMSWPRDRQRYAKVFRHFPGMRRLRVGTFGIALAGVALAVVGLGTGNLLAFFPGVAIATFFGMMYPWATHVHLMAIGQGTLTWRIGQQGIRVEGDLATEVPWAQVVRWRRIAEHVLVETRRPTTTSTGPAMAAPMQAFSTDAWLRAERLLRDRVGPEGARRAAGS